MLALACTLPGGAIAAPAVTVDTAALEACMELGMNDAGLACFRQIAEKARAIQRAQTIDPDTKPAVAGLPERDRQTHVTRGIILDNMEHSYITAGSGARFGSDQTKGNMLYEAQIFKNISWLDDKIFGAHVWLDIPIRIGIRQLTENSFPVKTPSYNPGLRLYVAPVADAARADSPIYYSLGLHHYSNGQDGRSIARDGAVNTSNGSFTTNYAEAAAHLHDDQRLIPWARFAFRQHFYGTWEPFQRGQYPKRHVSVELRSPEFRKDKQFATQFRLTETFGWGHKYIVKVSDSDHPLNIEARVRDRLHTTLEMFTRIRPQSNLALYLRYDYGHDYYNINFQRRMNRFQIGVASR